MAKYNLTDRQKELMRVIVGHIRSGKVVEPIIPVVTAGGEYIIGIDKDFSPNLTGNLEVLAEEGLLSRQFNNGGDTIYTVKQAGYEAVDNNFEIPHDLLVPQISIGAIVHEMRGGNLQAVGVALLDVQQIVNNPELLSEQLEKIANDLVETVKGELTASELMRYIETLEKMQAQLLAEKNPSPSVLRRLVQIIAFLGDIDGSLSLMVKVWPKIYPLLLILAEKVMRGG